MGAELDLDVGEPRSLTPEEQARYDEVEMRRAAATSGKEGSTPQPVDTKAAMQGEILRYLNKAGLAVPSKVPGVGQRIGVNSMVPDDELPFILHPHLTEGALTAMPGFEESASFLQDPLNTLAAVAASLNAVDTAFTTLQKDPSKTPQQRSLMVAKQSAAAFEKSFKSLGASAERLQTQADDLERQLNAPITSAGAGVAAAELRTVLRSMNKEDRMAAVRKAITDGDEVLVNAALGSHPLTTGIDPNMHTLMTRQVHEKRDPAKVQRLNATKGAIEVVQRAIPLLTKQFESAQRATFSQVTKLKGLSDASEAALAKIMGTSAA